MSWRMASSVFQGVVRTCGSDVSADLCRRRVGRVVRTFLADETGQDLIEYALLTATIGLSSAAAWVAMGPAMKGAYQSWDLNTYNLWNSPDPSP